MSRITVLSLNLSVILDLKVPACQNIFLKFLTIFNTQHISGFIICVPNKVHLLDINNTYYIQSQPNVAPSSKNINVKQYED